MAAEKTRLKFRVASHVGVSSSAPRWSEKWGVGLFDHEEFHATDQLLKLPFQESKPQTVCIFSIVKGSLGFRLVDSDRKATVNGKAVSEAILTIGDVVVIGEAVAIEVVLAPPKIEVKREPTLEPTLETKPEPKVEAAPKPVPQPQLEEPPLAKAAAPIPPIEASDGPTLTHTATKIPKPALTELRDKPIEIDEPSFNPAVRTSLARSVPARPFIPAAKLELEDSTRAGRDPSLEPDPTRTGEFQETLDEAPPRPSFLTRLSQTFNRRPREVPPERPARLQPAASPSSPRPWIPEAISSGARMRGRALVFIVAAIGTLMIAAGVFRIQNQVNNFEETRKQKAEHAAEMKRGIPIKTLEEQVQRLRRGSTRR